jgi:hypothetical protein
MPSDGTLDEAGRQHQLVSVRRLTAHRDTMNPVPEPVFVNLWSCARMPEGA